LFKVHIQVRNILFTKIHKMIAWFTDHDPSYFYHYTMPAIYIYPPTIFSQLYCITPCNMIKILEIVYKMHKTITRSPQHLNFNVDTGLTGLDPFLIFDYFLVHVPDMAPQPIYRRMRRPVIQRRSTVLPGIMHDSSWTLYADPNI
jgi:hypothetical protein